MHASRLRRATALLPVLAMAAIGVAIPGAAGAGDAGSAAPPVGLDSARMVGMWRVVIAAEADRPHLLHVSRLRPKEAGGYAVDATYGYIDKRRFAVDASLQPGEGGWVLRISTRRDAVLTLESADLLRFSGAIRFKQGPSSTVEMTREAAQ